MAENLSIESPDFRAIRKGDDHATEDAVRLLWFVLNDEMATRRKGVRKATERETPKILSSAPGAGSNNFDLQDAAILLFTGSTAVTITGLRAREEGDRIVIHVIGTGTITFSHDSASSDATNRMLFQAAANKAVATNRTLVLHYLNARFREMSLA